MAAEVFGLVLIRPCPCPSKNTFSLDQSTNHYYQSPIHFALLAQLSPPSVNEPMCLSVGNLGAIPSRPLMGNFYPEYD